MIDDKYTSEVYCINCGGEDMSAEGSYPSGDKLVCNDCGDSTWAIRREN